MTIRDAIRAAIQEQGLSAREVAEAAKMPRTNLSPYLAGKTDLTGKTLDRLLEALRLRVTRDTAR